MTDALAPLAQRARGAGTPHTARKRLMSLYECSSARGARSSWPGRRAGGDLGPRRSAHACAPLHAARQQGSRATGAHQKRMARKGGRRTVRGGRVRSARGGARVKIASTAVQSANGVTAGRAARTGTAGRPEKQRRHRRLCLSYSGACTAIARASLARKRDGLRERLWHPWPRRAPRRNATARRPQRLRGCSTDTGAAKRAPWGGSWRSYSQKNKLTAQDCGVDAVALVRAGVPAFGASMVNRFETQVCSSCCTG